MRCKDNVYKERDFFGVFFLKGSRDERKRADEKNDAQRGCEKNDYNDYYDDDDDAVVKDEKRTMANKTTTTTKVIMDNTVTH